MVAVDDRWVVLTEEHRVVHFLTWRRQKTSLRILEMCQADTAGKENRITGSKKNNKQETKFLKMGK